MAHFALALETQIIMKLEIRHLTKELKNVSKIYRESFSFGFFYIIEEEEEGEEKNSVQ